MKIVIDYTSGEYDDAYRHIEGLEYESPETFLAEFRAALNVALEKKNIYIGKIDAWRQKRDEWIKKHPNFGKLSAKMEKCSEKDRRTNKDYQQQKAEYDAIFRELDEMSTGIDSIIVAGISFDVDNWSKYDEKLDKFVPSDEPTVLELNDWFDSIKVQQGDSNA